MHCLYSLLLSKNSLVVLRTHKLGAEFLRHHIIKGSSNTLPVFWPFSRFPATNSSSSMLTGHRMQVSQLWSLQCEYEASSVTLLVAETKSHHPHLRRKGSLQLTVGSFQSTVSWLQSRVARDRGIAEGKQSTVGRMQQSSRRRRPGSSVSLYVCPQGRGDSGFHYPHPELCHACQCANAVITLPPPQHCSPVTSPLLNLPA